MADSYLVISKPKVMESGAGFYIGESYLEYPLDEYSWEGPYSRLSGYYATKEEAEKELKNMIRVNSLP